MRYAKEFTLTDKALTIGFWELSNYHVNVDNGTIIFSLKGFLSKSAKDPIVQYKVNENIENYANVLASEDLVQVVVDSVKIINEEYLMFN